MEYQLVVAVTIFILAYILIAIEKIDKTIVVVASGGLLILFNIFSQEFAFKETIDFNTIALLIGMMVIVMILKRTGIFEYIAIKVVKIAKAQPIKIMVYLSIITGLLSALLDNVTTILLIIPVTIRIAKDLNINPIPLIISQIFASNVGGTATLVGDPPNILIGSKVGLSFMDFVLNVGVIAIPLLFVTTYAFVLIFRKSLKVPVDNKDSVLGIDEKSLISDSLLLKKSLIVLGITLLGFLFHGVLNYESGTIAMAGAVLLLAISKIKAVDILHEVEWDTIFFFIGLFILVGGLKEVGFINILANGVLDLTKGDQTLTTLSILWVSAIASAIFDNIPFTAAMIGIIQQMGTMSGLDLWPIWWSLSLGACFGGNGTIIGASANVVAINIAKENGYKISFYYYLKVAFPLMIFTIIISTIYIYFRYLF